MKNDNLYYKGKHRITSVRLKGWDYRTPALYFITICTKNMKSFFGKINNGIMQLNELGQYAHDYFNSANTLKNNTHIINFVIMPNHVHAIIKLNNQILDKKENKFGPLLPGSLSSFVNHYKGSITKYAKNNDLHWDGWHISFHDYIIRNKIQYEKITNYISRNPLNWREDRYFREIA